MEDKATSNLPEKLPVLCHPVNRWTSSLVWFGKNVLQQQKRLFLLSCFIYSELENSCLDKNKFCFCIYITWYIGLHTIWLTYPVYQARWKKTQIFTGRGKWQTSLKMKFQLQTLPKRKCWGGWKNENKTIRTYLVTLNLEQSESTCYTSKSGKQENNSIFSIS